MGVSILDIVNDYIFQANKLSKSDKSEVYNIVSHVIRFTRTYISRTRQDQADIPSQMLSTIWQEASNTLKKLGNNELKIFAEILENKSKYWTDPEGFRPDVLDEYAMKLTQVEIKLNELTV